MIRFVWALIGLRWQLLRNTLRGDKGRDSLERFSRVIALIVPGFLAVSLALTAMALGFLALAGGFLVGSGSLAPGVVLLPMRAALFAALLLLVLIPLGATSGDAAARYSRLLLLPISHRALHLVEVLATLAEPWIAVALPAIPLFAAGLLLAGRPAAAAIALAAGVALIVLFAALGSLVTFLLTWLLLNRRRSELFTLVFVLAICLVSVVPALVSDDLEQRMRGTEPEGIPATGWVDRALPAWSAVVPSEGYARAVGSGLGARPGRAWLGVAALFLEAALIYQLSFLVHRRLITSAPGGGASRRTAAGRIAGLRLPGMTPAASAVALTQALTALRSVRGRFVVLLPGPLLVVLAVISRRVPEEFPGGDFLGTHGYALFGVGILFSLYALLGFTMNQFASDRAGLTLQLLAPLREADLLKGKAVGLAIVFSATLLVCLAGALVGAPGGHPLAWVSCLLGGVATYLLMCPLAALMSALFPVASDLSKTGSGGNPHGLAMLVGTLSVLLLSAPQALILAMAHRFLGVSPGFVLIALWTLLSAAVSAMLLGLVARLVPPRRENLALVAGGK